MSIVSFIGIIILTCALSLTTFLVAWSTRSINKIDREKGRTLREILRERRGEK